MKISYNWLSDYLEGKLPKPEKLADLLTLHSFEVERIEKKGGDFILEIDVLPNRTSDCLSHLGVAREIAVLTNLNLKTQISKPHLKSQNFKTKDFVEVEVKDKTDCPRYTAKVILGVKVDSSPKWLQERLKVCALQPINNVVDITNYVMLETGQPLHVFDFEKIKSENPKSQIKTIIVRRAKKGEKIATLDDKTYELNKDILLIADKEGPLAIAGIKGGKKAEIDEKTKNIVIEAANFEQRVVRRGSRKLKLRTNASWRFESGLDPNLIDFAQQRVSALIQEIAGGKIAQGMVDFYPQKVRTKKIKLNLNYTEKLLGVKIPKQKIIKILKSLGLKIVPTLSSSDVTGESSISNRQTLAESGENFTPYRPRPEKSRRRAGAGCKLKILKVEIPTFRPDISIEEDLIEEIGRVYGFQNIPSNFPQTTLIPPERNDDIFYSYLSQNILKEIGFSETYNYSFIGEKEKNFFGWDNQELIGLENPISSFNRYLRPSLIPNLLNNVKENLKFFEEIKIFEIGKTFQKSQISNLKCQMLEKKMLAGVLTRRGIKDEGFYELKGVVDDLLNKLGISNVWYAKLPSELRSTIGDDYGATLEESKLEIWHPKNSAEIKSDGEEIGFLGEIHPKIQEGLAIGERVFLFDLDVDKLLKLVSQEYEYQPILIYPAVIRDLAILVPQGTKTVEVLNKIEQVGGKLVGDVDLFDIYQGKELPQDKENLAFHIIYQAEDRTLKSEEVDKIHQRIIKALEENSEWEVRK
ncbi:MAG: phenylalanine--tRNA ligase subunit beta [Patescibacteria group bacterium]|nr:phenylalanine--tRNA ligase subunit beta [Patescibacteria group bacterium]